LSSQLIFLAKARWDGVAMALHTRNDDPAIDDFAQLLHSPMEASPESN
jgi:hypothetical protein